MTLYKTTQLVPSTHSAEVSRNYDLSQVNGENKAGRGNRARSRAYYQQGKEVGFLVLVLEFCHMP
jgi:hypothetical protein